VKFFFQVRNNLRIVQPGDKKWKNQDQQLLYFFTICLSLAACRWCPFWDCVHMDGQSFAPIGLHETGAASDRLITKRHWTGRSKTTKTSPSSWSASPLLPCVPVRYERNWQSPDPGFFPFRIYDPGLSGSKKGGRKFSRLLFCSHKFHKIKIFKVLNRYRKNF
jgi:hypothetical protein